jgi:hypothetical protein
MNRIAALAPYGGDDHNKADLHAAERCWSWHQCPFGCRFVDDCVLLTPLPVVADDQQAPRAAA